jgi:VanZ family protein
VRFPWWSGVITMVILVAMLTPAESIPKTGIQGSDIVVHVVVFALWAFVVSREFAAAAATVLVAGGVLAVATELLQMLVPGRMFAIADLVSNAIGLFLGVGLAQLAASGRGQESSANSARAAGESHASAD